MDTVHLLRALSFAALKHRDQRRKDPEASPYINHPIAVATVLAVEGGVKDEGLLIAGVLHDTVEDTKTTFEELEEHFGSRVSGLVREVTDDKALPKEERKRLQVEHARGATPDAKQVKIADKICNVRDVGTGPPKGWSLERRVEYLDWSARVVANCRGVNPRLDEAFDEALGTARKALGAEAS